MLYQVYMEPLKKAQVEGFLMYAEPEVLFGNLDELCSVSKKILVCVTLFIRFPTNKSSIDLHS